MARPSHPPFEREAPLPVGRTPPPLVIRIRPIHQTHLRIREHERSRIHTDPYLPD